MRRAVRLAVLTAVLLLLTAEPALAHSLNGASASNYRTRVTGMSPEVPGIRVKPVEVGNRLELTNHTRAEVVVLGFSETPEPFLRIGPKGVFENLRSPATYSSKARYSTAAAPAIAKDPNAEPQWHKVSGASSYRWHDHRVHWMLDKPPPAVRRDPGTERVILPEWKLGLRYRGRDITVTGDLTWVPGPSSFPWLGLAVLTGLAVVAVFGVWRGAAGPLGRALAAGLLVVLGALDAARLAGVASDSASSFLSALGNNVQAIVTWLAAAGAVAQLARRGLRPALPLVAAAGVLFTVGSAVDLSVLSHSQIPSTAPAWLSRLSVAAGLGAGLGLVGAAGWRLTAPLAPP